MIYAKSTGGFYDRAIHGDAIPADAVDITAAHHAELLTAQSAGQRIEADANGYPVAVDPQILPPAVPVTVTMRQARLALLAKGLLANVDAAVAGMPGADGDAARIEWEYAATVDRNSQLVASLSSALGLTSAQLDALFIAAAGL